MAIRPLAECAKGSVMVALGLLEGLFPVKISRRVRASFGGGLPAIVAGNLRRDVDRRLWCVRDLDRFSAGEATLNLPATQFEQGAAPAL